MHLRRLSRSSSAFWAVALAVSLLTGLTAARLMSRARHDAALYGAPVPVVVAAQRVDAGDVVEPADVVVRPVPSSWSPDRALRRPAQAVGQTVVVTLLPGLPVTSEHLAPDGLAGITALLGAGERAVAVPRDAASVPLRRGDHVDVVASGSGGPGGDVVAGVRLVPASRVLDVGDEAATVAVPEDRAAEVAAYALEGLITLAVSGPRTGPAPPGRPPPGRSRTAPANGSAPAAAPATRPWPPSPPK